MWAKATSSHHVTQLTLWFGFLGSAAAWFIHLVVVYTIAEAVCIVGLPDFEIIGIAGLVAVIVGITLAAVAVSVVSGLVARRNQVQLRKNGNASRGTGRLMTYGGLYLSVYFTFVIVAQLFPIFYLQPCP